MIFLPIDNIYFVFLAIFECWLVCCDSNSLLYYVFFSLCFFVFFTYTDYGGALEMRISIETYINQYIIGCAVSDSHLVCYYDFHPCSFLIIILENNRLLLK